MATKRALAKITDNQTAMVLGAGLLLAVGGVWYIDYRARTVIRAAADAAGVAVDTTNNLATVAAGMTPGNIMTGITREVMGFWGKLLGVGGTSSAPASDQGVL